MMPWLGQMPSATGETTGRSSSLVVGGLLAVGCQEGTHAMRQVFAIEGLAFPDHQDSPAEGLEFPSHPCVSSTILGELVRPVGGARPRTCRPTATSMAMPETPVYENDASESREDKVRRARKIARMTGELVSQGLDSATNAQFRRGVFLTHTGHQRRSFRIDLPAVALHVLL
jgi:hypothetical protein